MVLRTDLTSLSFPVSYLEVGGELIRALAGDKNAVLAQTGLKRELLRQPGMTVDGEQLKRGLLACHALCRADRPLSVQLLAHFPMTKHGVLGMLAMTASTCGQALDVALRFYGLVMPAVRIRRVDLAREVELVFELVYDFGAASQTLVEMVMGAFLQVLPFLERDLPRPHFAFSHAASHAPSAYQPLFGDKVTFGAACNSVRIDARVLSLPLRTRSQTTHATLAATLHSQAAGHDAKVTTERVRRVLKSALKSGRALAMERIADELAMSSRTLSRRLRAEGTTLPRLSNEVRVEYAQALLLRGKHNIAEVAHAVGYGDAASFARAYRRVTGQRPSEVRPKLA